MCGCLLLVTWQPASYLSLRKTQCTVAEVQRTDTDPENPCEHFLGCHTADILSFLVLEKHNFCEFPHQIISVTLCPSRLEMPRAMQWHSGFGAAWKHMILIKITSSAVAEHSNLTPRGGGISPMPSDDTILGAVETSSGHLTHAQFGIKKGDWIYNIHELHYYYYFFTR